MRSSLTRRFAVVIVLIGLLGAAVVQFGNTAFRAFESDRPSRSQGTPAAGSLQNGKRLPTSGPNFRAYSKLGALLGRNSLHGTIREVVLEAYAALADSAPELTFVYGETGWPSGGRFAPHRTHQNGLSADFMVPVRDRQNLPVPLPTHPWERFGYDLTFDPAGRSGQLTIDFEALAAHLSFLDTMARRHGSGIALLILAPEYYERVWATKAGAPLRGRFPILARPAWVRHDEHYHVDFRNPAG